jgi:PhnB protein
MSHWDESEGRFGIGFFGIVVVQLTVPDAAAAIDFYRTALGARELYRNQDPETGRVYHCELMVAGARLTLHDEIAEFGLLAPSTIGGTPVGLNVYVDDVDAAFERAIAAGGTALSEPADYFWGMRSGALLDPFGHRWILSTAFEDPSPDEILARSHGVSPAMHLSAARKPPKG